MAIEEDCPFDTACFHCQQAAEKYLKCLLTWQDIQAPRTHNPEALATLIPQEYGIPVTVECLVELNPYAVNVRYADDWREPRPDQARPALEIALQVRAAVRSFLPAPVLE